MTKSPHIGSGAGQRFGSMGTNSVVFPDTDKEALAFKRSLGRSVVASDKVGWDTYAGRLSIPKDASDRAWASLRTRKGVSEAMDLLNRVFEASGSGSWMLNPLAVKMRHGAPDSEPSPTPVKPSGAIAPTPPSFPFHTKVSRKIYEKALKMVRLYPLEGPSQILKRAIMAAGATPLVDVTPEDEKLLRMAIDFAQNGPAGEPNKIGGAPGGPLNPSPQ
jgi:hypothetical protein